MTAGLVLTGARQGSDAWLAMRRSGVTATDLPVITGNRPGLYELWAYKRGLLERDPPDAATQELYDLGHALEPVIADAYARKTGRPLRRVERMIRHREVPWLFASLDRVSAVRGERLVVELKASFHGRWSDGPEPVPAAVQDQVQAQLMASGYPMAHVAVLSGGRLDWHELPADRGYQDDLMGLARWFRGLVESGEPPPVDGSESTRRALARMWPSDRGGAPLPSWPAIEALASDWQDAKQAAKAADEAEGAIANAVRALLGDAPGVEGDGWRITCARNRDGSKTDWKAVAEALAHSFTEPDVMAQCVRDHTTATEGARPLRLWTKGDKGGWT